jgi:DNA invertase Pin-like site-specific DNA recombinase
MSKRTRGQKFKSIEREELISKIERYVLNGKSATEISRELDIHFQSVRKLLNLIHHRWRKAPDKEETEEIRSFIHKKYLSIVFKADSMYEESSEVSEKARSAEVQTKALSKIARLHGLEKLVVVDEENPFRELTDEEIYKKIEQLMKADEDQN